MKGNTWQSWYRPGYQFGKALCGHIMRMMVCCWTTIFAVHQPYNSAFISEHILTKCLANFHFPIKQKDKCLCDNFVCCKYFGSCPSLIVSWMTIQHSNGELNLKYYFSTAAIQTKKIICKIRLFYIFFWYFDHDFAAAFLPSQTSPNIYMHVLAYGVLFLI